MRAKFLAHCAPYLRDIVFAGHDGDYVAALIFPNVEACRVLVVGGSDAEVVRSEPGSRQIPQACFRSWRKRAPAVPTGWSGRC